MEKFQETSQLYKQGKYIECRETLKKLLTHLTGKCTDDIQFSLKCIVDNNLTLCLALEECSQKTFISSWQPRLNSFILHFNNWRSFPMIPLQLRLTQVYNALHWYWMRPKIYQQSDVNLHDLLEMACHCLMRVLESLKVSSIGCSDSEDVEENLCFLIEMASNYFPKLNRPTAIALVKLLTIVHLIFLQKKPNQYFWQSAQSIENALQGMKLLEKHLLSEPKIKNSSNFSLKSGYFTFGFNNLSSNLDDEADNHIDSFILILLMELVVHNKIELLMETLKTNELFRRTSAFTLYLKAYFSFSLGQSDEAFINLCLMQGIPLNNDLKFHFHVLLGRYYSKMKNLEKAAAEFMTAKNISVNRAPEALYYLFRSCEEGNFIMQIHFLDEIYKINKEIDDIKDIPDLQAFFEISLLNILHATPALTKEEVIYLLGKVNLEHQKYSNAETFYLKLLELLKSSCDVTDCDSSKRLVPLPKFHIIYHEAAKSSVECGNLEVALENCQACFENYMPVRYPIFGHDSENELPGKMKYYDDYLNSVDQDCISLILMSQIFFQMNEDSKALDYVERCIRLVLEHINTGLNIKNPISGSKTESSQELIFFKCFLAKLYLCKAILFKNMDKSVGEIVPLFEKALTFNKGDSDVLQYFARALIMQGCDEEALSLKNTERFDLDTARCFSTVLKLFFKLQTSEEKWGETDSPEDIVADLFENSG